MIKLICLSLVLAITLLAGDIRQGGSLIGRIESGGGIRKNGSLVRKVEIDGGIRVNGTLAGKVERDGDVRKGGSIIGRVEGVPPAHAAIIFFWDFVTL